MLQGYKNKMLQDDCSTNSNHDIRNIILNEDESSTKQKYFKIK